MSVVVCGLNHNTASLPIREQLVFPGDEAKAAAKELIEKQSIQEALVFSSCNRTEIYAETSDAASVIDWLQYNSIKKSLDLDLKDICYTYSDQFAVKHLIRVASGLDSMLLGEPQILGQMKKAYHLACHSGTVGNHLRFLFPAAFSASKQIRHQTGLGKNPVSHAYAVVQLAKSVFKDLMNCSILLIGAGETIELISAHLHTQGAQSLTIANRTLDRAKSLSELYNARAITLSDVPKVLLEADIVISAINSPLPILGKGLVERVLKKRKPNSLFMVDLGIPRNIEPEVKQLNNVHIYNVDDLKAVIGKNWAKREAAAKQAEVMAEMQAEHYICQLRVLNAGSMIQSFRKQVENMRDQELIRAMRYLQKYKDPQLALSYLANSLTTKVLHHPTTQLRRAAYESRVELLLAAKDLFDL